MSTYSYEFRVRQEQNKDLLQEAEFERWLASVGLLQTSEERFGRRLIRQSREWLARTNRSLPCNEPLPACGLIPV